MVLAVTPLQRARRIVLWRSSFPILAVFTIVMVVSVMADAAPL